MKQQEAISYDFYDFPRYELAQYPTPLQRFENVEKDINGIQLWVKRDDLISFGFGGNKIRALEFIAADALKRRVKTLITGAGAQSNHVRATAAVAGYLNMNCIAIYWGSAPKDMHGNYYLTNLLGAEIRFTEDLDRSSVDRMMHFIEREVMYGSQKPYVIPRGGACALGVIAHMFAAQELLQQTQSIGIETDIVTLAVGSGGTIAGWILGQILFDHPWRIEGFTVSRPSLELKEIIVNLIHDAAEVLKITVQINREDIVIHDGCIGNGYGVPSVKGNDAIKKVALNQGVFFDPIYTGKAFAGFLEHASNGHYQNVHSAVFLHTGGEPALFQ